MKIFYVYLDELKIKETTLDNAVDKLEGNGYWKKGSVKSMLKSGQVVHNPFCIYANSRESLYKHISN